MLTRVLGGPPLATWAVCRRVRRFFRARAKWCGVVDAGNIENAGGFAVQLAGGLRLDWGKRGE